MKQLLITFLLLTTINADFILDVSYVPSGFKLLKEIKGDVTKDGKDDLIKIFEMPAKNEDKEIRRLYLFRNIEDSNSDCIVENDNAVWTSEDGGMMGDPLDDIYIKNGSLFFSYYGGSAWRWSVRFQFLMRDGILSLVGKEDTSENINTSETKATSTNYLSGKRLIKERIINENRGELSPLTERWERLGKKPLLPLATFDINGNY